MGLYAKTPNKVMLSENIVIPVGEKRGFFLHTDQDGIMFSNGDEKDDSLAIRGVGMCGDTAPFAQNDNTLYHIAGSVVYSECGVVVTLVLNTGGDIVATTLDGTEVRVDAPEAKQASLREVRQHVLKQLQISSCQFVSEDGRVFERGDLDKSVAD